MSPTKRNLPERRIARKTRLGAAKPAFAGPGHTAVQVVGADRLSETDPFVLLMDDRLDFRPGQPVGEAHPHAGLETVTLMLDGELNDSAFGPLRAGDVEWMTAGRGVVHSEDVKAAGRARVLQLWLMLPQSERDSEPELQIVPLAMVPIRREPGVEARLYSGRSGALVSPTRNRVPTTIADFRFEPNASVTQALSGGWTAFVYVIEGTVQIGGEAVEAGEVAWLDRTEANETIVSFRGGSAGGRAVFYAGEPQKEPIVTRGPFVAGSEAELSARFAAYRSGAFQRLTDIPVSIRSTAI